MVLPNENNKPKAPDELLKTTSLLYFKEALRNQQFEQCPTLIKTAKRFGAQDADIRRVINDFPWLEDFSKNIIHFPYPNINLPYKAEPGLQWQNFWTAFHPMIQFVAPATDDNCSNKV